MALIAGGRRLRKGVSPRHRARAPADRRHDGRGRPPGGRAGSGARLHRKGNDQVRFDVTTAALAPDVQGVAPVREWNMNRDDEIEYASKHGIEVPATTRSPYSTDENLWGRSIEAGVLEDPWAEPPADVYAWTRDPRECPDEPAYVEIGFKQGIPISLDGKETDPLQLVTELNRIGGESGV